VNPIIIESSRLLADKTAECEGIQKAFFDFIPMASCAITIRNGYEIEGRDFWFPKDISIATHGRALVNQARKAKEYITQNGGTIKECSLFERDIGHRRDTQKPKVGEDSE